jgi:hypothetical protein
MMPTANDEGQSLTKNGVEPNDEGWSSMTKGGAQRRRLEPNDEGWNLTAEGRSQRRKAEPNDEG